MAAKKKDVELNIELGRRNYVSGALVEGVVRITCRVPTMFIAARLCLSGKQISTTHIDKAACIRDSTVDDAENVSEHAVAYFHCDLQTLCGLTPEMIEEGCHKDDEMTLQEGHYSYPFSFEIPADAPPSIQIDGETFTKIGYQMKAYIQTKSNPEAYGIKLPINVFQPMSRQQYNQENKGISAKLQFDVQRCFCISAPVFAHVAVGRTTIVQATDKISCDVAVDNSQNRFSVDGCTFIVFMHLAAEGKKDVMVEVTRFHSDMKIEAKKAGSYHARLAWPIDQQKKFPPTMPTFHGPITYHLKVELDIPFAPDPCWSTMLRVVPILEEQADVKGGRPQIDFHGCMKMRSKTKRQAYKDGSRVYRPPSPTGDASKDFVPIPENWRKAKAAAKSLVAFSRLMASVSGSQNPLLAPEGSATVESPIAGDGFAASEQLDDEHPGQPHDAHPRRQHKSSDSIVTQAAEAVLEDFNEASTLVDDDTSFSLLSAGPVVLPNREDPAASADVPKKDHRVYPEEFFAEDL